MKRFKKILAIVFTLIMICTNSTMQYAFAENDTTSNSEGGNAYTYTHDEQHWYQYRSPHRYGYTKDETYTYGYAPAVYRLLSGKDNTTVSIGYCCDLLTDVVPGTQYKRLNLEEAGYYSKDAAKHIRSILNNGYWQDVKAEVPDLSTLQKNAGISADDELTPAEALAATQYAIWHYANVQANEKITYFNFYSGTSQANNGENEGRTADPESVNLYESAKGYNGAVTRTHIEDVYNYLIDLDGTEPTSIIWNFKGEDLIVDADYIEAGSNDTYDVTVKFELTGSSGEKDGLTLTAEPVMSSNDVKKINSKSIALKDLTETDGYYTITFEDLTAEQIETFVEVDFTLDGTQNVQKKDVFFYESEKDENDEYIGQCFVGFAEGSTSVHREWTMAIDNKFTEKTLTLIKYDEESAVKATSAEHAKQLEDAGMIKVNDDGDGTFAKYAFSVVGAEFQLYAKTADSEKGVKVGEPKVTDENGVVSWKMLSTEGVEYYCEEVKAPVGYKLPDGMITFKLDSDEARAYISNCHDTGDILISKTVQGSADNDNIDTAQHFNFEVKVDFTKADAYNRLTEQEKSISNDQMVLSGKVQDDNSHSAINWKHSSDNDGNKTDIWTANIKLADGESLAINDLPVGTECTVTEHGENNETINDSERFIYNDILYVTADAQQSINVQSGNYALDDEATADKDESKNVIGFVNTKYADQGQITLTKEFIGEAADGTYYFRLFNEDGQVTDAFHGRQMIREIKVKDGKAINKAVFTGVPFGEYTVYEVDAEGNRLVKSKVDDNGDGNIVTLNGTKYVVNGEGAVSVSQNSPNAALTITNTSLTITKTDITGNDEVAGAELKITEKTDGTSEGKVIDEWTSTEESHVVKSELEKGKTYVITEVTAPKGYAYITTDIEFQINEDGSVTILDENKNAEISEEADENVVGILVKDDAIHFNVDKTDLQGTELAGSEITVYEYNQESKTIGKKVESWTSDAKSAYDFGSLLTAGETYLLRETNAPDGYGYIGDVIFSVDKDGSIKFIENSLPTMKSDSDDGVQVMDLDNEVSNAADNEEVYLVKDGQTKVTVSKEDQNEEAVIGAKLAIIDVETGNIVKDNDGKDITWTTDGKDKDITGLLIAGKTYKLTELEAPEGYEKAKDIEFTVPKENGKTGDVTMVDVKSNAGDDEGNNDGNTEEDEEQVTLIITKTDITGNDEVAGAELKITEKTDDTSEGKVIDEWTSTEESHVVKGELEKGKTYVITEVTAPEGYAYITTDIEFQINEDGSVTILDENKNAEISEEADENVVGILVKDDAIHFNVDKTDLQGTELAGSEITVYEYNQESKTIGKKVDSWTSDAKSAYDFGSLLTAGETYLLRETNAPDGYGYIEDVIFSVDKDGSIKFIENSLPTMKSDSDDGVQVMDLDNEVSKAADNEEVYLVKDGQTKVTVSKEDQNEEAVVGAKLAIIDVETENIVKDNDGKDITWTTDGKDKDITGLLIAGKAYKLTELEAPEGYQKADDIEFTVPKENGKTGDVTMVDVKSNAGDDDSKNENNDENNNDNSGDEDNNNNDENNTGDNDNNTTEDNDNNTGGNGSSDNNNGGNNAGTDDSSDNSVSTGDRTNVGLCLMLMTAAMAAGLGALTFRRKA